MFAKARIPATKLLTEGALPTGLQRRLYRRRGYQVAPDVTFAPGVVIEGNDASARLLGRLGFRQEARLVDGVLFKGAWATQLVFALLEDEWREPSAVG